MVVQQIVKRKCPKTTLQSNHSSKQSNCTKKSIPFQIVGRRWTKHFVDTIRRVPRSGHTKCIADQESLQNGISVSNKMASPTLQKYNLVTKFPDRNKSGISDHNPDPYNLVTLLFFDPWQFQSRHWEWREWFFLCKNHGGKTQWIRIKFSIFFTLYNLSVGQVILLSPSLPFCNGFWSDEYFVRKAR